MGGGEKEEYNSETGSETKNDNIKDTSDDSNEELEGNKEYDFDGKMDFDGMKEYDFDGKMDFDGMEEYDFDGKMDFDGMKEYDFDGKMDFDGMEEYDEENRLEPIEDSDESQKPDKDGNTDDIDNQSSSAEQGNESYENLNSESTSTVLICENREEKGENLKSNNQNQEKIEEINQEEFDKEIEKELEEGVEAINQYLEEEAEFINAYQEMVGEARELDGERESEGEECLKTEEEWEKEVETAAYTAEQLYESTNEIETNANNEELSEINEELEIEKKAEQTEEVLEPQLSDLQEEFEEGMNEIEQHQVEPLIEEALEIEPEPIVKEKELEQLQEMHLEEQFQTVHDKEYIEELVETQEEMEQIKEQEVEAQLNNTEEIIYELEEEIDEVEQHQVEAAIEEALETETKPNINEEKLEQLQEMELEEQFQTVHFNEYIEELVEKQEEEKTQEHDKLEQEQENSEQIQEVIQQPTYLQEELEEQELELEYGEKDEVEQHQVEAAIEEELETELKPIIKEEELEYIKNFEPEKQLDAELLYELIEELVNKQNEEKEESEGKEEQEELSTEEKVALIKRELGISQKINSGEGEVQSISQEEVLEYESISPDVSEQSKKIEQEALNEIDSEEEDSDQTAEENYENLKMLYRQQTGKRPIYANLETKGFKQWLDQKKEAEKKEKTKQEQDLKEEQKNAEPWKGTLKNRIEEASEIEPELKSKLIKLVEKYNKLEELIKKYSQLYNKAKRKELSQNERKELNSLVKGLLKLDSIKIELFLGLREIKRYIDKDDYYYYEYWNNQRHLKVFSHFFTQLSQNYNSLKQAQRKKSNTENVLKNWIANASEHEIDSYFKAKLKEVVENYNELEKLAIRFMELNKKDQLRQISQSEKIEFNSLIKTLKKLDPINVELFANVRAIKHYLNDQHLDNSSEEKRVNRILNQFMRLLSQKYKNLTQRILIERSEVQLIYNELKNTGIPIERIKRILRNHKDLDLEFIGKLNTILQEVEYIKIISQKQIGEIIGCSFEWIVRAKASIKPITLKRLELLANEKINSEAKIWRNEEMRLINPGEIKKIYLKLKNKGIGRSRLKKIIEESRESDREFSIQLEQLGYKKFSSREEIGELLGINFRHILNPEKKNTTKFETLRKLEFLLNREIPHKVMQGQYEKLYIDETEELVELVAIILGDGSIYSSNGKYSLRIALNDKHDKQYIEYVKSLMLKVFNVEPKLQPVKGATVLSIWRKSVTHFLISKGLKAGDKVENQVSVPDWAKSKSIVRCLKGLIDTDGWIGVVKSNKTIEIKFSSSSLPLITNFKELCNSLGIRTGNIVKAERYSKKKKKMIAEFSLGIHSKEHVKNFITIIKPQKWNYRYNIIGLILIAISNPEKWIIIKKRLAIKYPDGKTHWNREYEDYLMQLCKNEGYEISLSKIKEAIDYAFSYRRNRT